MEKYIVTQKTAEQFTPLFINGPSGKESEGRQYLDKLIPELNSLVEEWKNYWQESPSVKEIIDFLKSERPGSFIKERYVRIQRDGSGTLQQFDLNKIMDLIEVPGYDELLNAYNRALSTLEKLNQVDDYFGENLNRFWNGSVFYNNQEVFDDYERISSSYTESIQENILLAIVHNLCESLEVLNNIGLRLNKGNFGEKISILLTAHKEVVDGHIQHEFSPSHRIKKVARTKVRWNEGYEKLIFQKVPNGFELDDNFLLVGKHSERIEEAIGIIGILIDRLNSLCRELEALFGSSPSLEDIKTLIGASDVDLAIKILYIEKRDIGIPGVKVKIDEFVKITQLPDYSGVLNALEAVIWPLGKAIDLGFGSIEYFYTDKGFKLTTDHIQEIKDLNTFYTHGYYESVALCALNQFAEACNELRTIGYPIPYPNLPFKLRSLLKLDKNTGRIKVEPSIFEKKDTYIKIKGLQNKEYRKFIPESFSVEFNDVSEIFSNSVREGKV